MLFAAGLGTRLKPFTDHHPKALAMVNGKSLLQRNLEYLKQYGIKQVVVNVHHFAQQIINAVHANKGWGLEVWISDETEAVLETGGGLKKAQNLLAGAEDFVVMNADILTNLNLKALMEFHITNKPLASLATTSRATSRYLCFDEKGQLKGWQNNQTGAVKNPHQLSDAEWNNLQPRAFSGIQILNQSIFQYMLPDQKFSMIDVYLQACTHASILSYDHSNDLLLDVGKPESLEKANELFK